MNSIHAIHLLFWIFCLTGCSINEFRPGILRIRLELPSGSEGITPDSTTLTLTNQSLSTTYKVLTDGSGCAELSLPAGSYVISVQKAVTGNNTDYILSGGLSNIHFKGDGEDLDLIVPLIFSKKSRLLISEVYFSGCMLPDGKSSYQKDGYVTLANNSSETLYLDGLCIAQMAPITTQAKPSGWMLHTDMSELPIFLMCWQFPGNGTDYPIDPGKEQTIAINAINHTTGEVSTPASVDLSRVEWAFWNPVLTGSQINAGVTPLDLVWRNAGVSYMITVSGPTVILFRPESDMTTWAGDASHLRTEPGSIVKTLYLHIPAAWLMDAVNYVSSAATKANSRLPSTLDGEPGVSSASGSGTSVRRKQSVENGRPYWQDTNNTAADFEETAPTLKAIR